MEYFLPIAEVYVNLPLIFILSLVVGVLSGLFGVGGGFLMTPFLIFLGVPPAYAVPNEANNILGTSISGSIVACGSILVVDFNVNVASEAPRPELYVIPGPVSP